MRATTALLAALGAALAAAVPVHAQQPPPRDDAMGELAMDLTVGERKSLCPCPVSGLVCDDTSVVKLVDAAAGPSLEGLKPGATTCSLYGPNRIKRTYRVTVRKPEDQKAPSPARPQPAPGAEGR